MGVGGSSLGEGLPGIHRPQPSPATRLPTPRIYTEIASAPEWPEGGLNPVDPGAFYGDHIEPTNVSRAAEPLEPGRSCTFRYSFVMFTDQQTETEAKELFLAEVIVCDQIDNRYTLDFPEDIRDEILASACRGGPKRRHSRARDLQLPGSRGLRAPGPAGGLPPLGLGALDAASLRRRCPRLSAVRRGA